MVPGTNYSRENFKNNEIDFSSMLYRDDTSIGD